MRCWVVSTYRDTDSIWEESFERDRHDCVVGAGKCDVPMPSKAEAEIEITTEVTLQC